MPELFPFDTFGSVYDTDALERCRHYVVSSDEEQERIQLAAHLTGNMAATVIESKVDMQHELERHLRAVARFAVTSEVAIGLPRYSYGPGRERNESEDDSYWAASQLHQAKSWLVRVTATALDGVPDKWAHIATFREMVEGKPEK